ncbi:hypothetical protein LDENG_00127250 [Lucifuga dentata]|nr:hypothetical protein LDENG_00127250 [Lucifuga dentata]
MMTVSGKHLTVLKVLNCGSQDELCIRDVKILPNYSSSFLPVMPDGSVLIVDNVCHQSAEVTMASFCRVDSQSSHLPSTLSALEEHNFLFHLQLQDKGEDDSSEGLEVPLVAVLQWYAPKCPFTRFISTHYSLPSIQLDRPQLVMTASCPPSARLQEPFWVKYTLLNNLQDFLAVRLVWTPEASPPKGHEEVSGGAVLCRSPHNYLGRKGSTLSFSVAFQILRTGLFELSQHMKLKLQFTASMSAPTAEPPSLSGSSRKTPSPGPACRELLELQGVGRLQSFSHQQPRRSHLIRTGSAMERRGVTPRVGSPVGRPLLSLDKIAKRECKILVLEGKHGDVRSSSDVESVKLISTDQ